MRTSLSINQHINDIAFLPVFCEKADLRGWLATDSSTQPLLHPPTSAWLICPCLPGPIGTASSYLPNIVWTLSEGALRGCPRAVALGFWRGIKARITNEVSLQKWCLLLRNGGRSRVLCSRGPYAAAAVGGSFGRRKCARWRSWLLLGGHFLWICLRGHFLGGQDRLLLWGFRRLREVFSELPGGNCLLQE